MRVNGQEYRTVWTNRSSVFMIDQNRLPFEFKIVEAKDFAASCDAIRNMTVRGAGATGVSAGYAMAQAFVGSQRHRVQSAHFWDYIDSARSNIERTRPTAQNLFYAVNKVYEAARASEDPVSAALVEAERIADEDIENCKRIGEFGQDLIKDGANLETHCNAGWLAFVDYGTALAPIYVAHRNGKKVFVYVDETRPRGQGARLTAWELRNEYVPHRIVADNAGAFLMSKGEVDMVIVGADRIARNGDVANKIGTLEKAICAKEFGIPFYVAAPTSTIDSNCASGKDIPIENRNEDEVLFQSGRTEDGRVENVLVCAPGSMAENPAFDVTRAKYIAGIITEKGIIKPNEREIIKILS